MLEKLPGALGEALQHQRAGFENTVMQRLVDQLTVARIEVSSTAFGMNERIPIRYTADGVGVSPPLAWQPIPKEAHSVVVIVEDADSPTPKPLVHAIVVNLSVDESALPEGALESAEHSGLGLQTGRNSYLMQAWLPPDPPPGHGMHHYVFQVFALRAGVEFSAVPGRQELVEAVAAHAIAAGHLVGVYERVERIRLNQTELDGFYDGALAGA